jgi:hypothetical protein
LTGKPLEFVGQIVFQRWYYIDQLQMRIFVETTETHFRDTGQPASHAEPGDVIMPTYLDFLRECEAIGSYQVGWQDRWASMVAEYFGDWLNRWLYKKPFSYTGLLLHPNRLVK